MNIRILFGPWILLVVESLLVRECVFSIALCLSVRTLVRDFGIILSGCLLLSILQVFCEPLLQVEVVRSLRRLMDIQISLRVRSMRIFLLLIDIQVVLCLDDWFF